MTLSSKIHDANAEAISEPLFEEYMQHFIGVGFEGRAFRPADIEAMMSLERFEKKSREFKAARQANFKKISCQT